MEILINHAHTDLSNTAEQEVRDFPAINHQVDYRDIVEELDEDKSVVIAGTEHWRVNEYSELENYVRDNGGDTQRHDTHLSGELGGTEFAALYGVEGSIDSEKQHFTVSGVDINEIDAGRDFINMDTEEVYEIARESAWITPAHPFLPGFSVSDDNLEDIVEMDEDEDIEVMIPYTAGYNPVLNKLAQGRHRENDVEDLASNYDLPMIPEADMHCYVPDSMSGFGVVDGVVEEARNGEIDIEGVRDSYVVEGTVSDQLMSFYRSGQSFADLLPGYRSGLYEKVPIIPTSEQDFEDIWDRSLDNLSEERLSVQSLT